MPDLRSWGEQILEYGGRNVLVSFGIRCSGEPTRIVTGYVVEELRKLDERGCIVTDVETIVDPKARADLRGMVRERGYEGNISFW